MQSVETTYMKTRPYNVYQGIDYRNNFFPQNHRREFIIKSIYIIIIITIFTLFIVLTSQKTVLCIQFRPRIRPFLKLEEIASYGIPF